MEAAENPNLAMLLKKGEDFVLIGGRLEAARLDEDIAPEVSQLDGQCPELCFGRCRQPLAPPWMECHVDAAPDYRSHH